MCIPDWERGEWPETRDRRHGRLLCQDPDAWTGRVIECGNRFFGVDVRSCKTEKESVIK